MQNITTTAKETFTYGQSCNLAWMIYVRFGRDVAAATAAWRRLMQNSTLEYDFGTLLQNAPMNEERVRAERASMVHRIAAILSYSRPDTIMRFHGIVDLSPEMTSLPIRVVDELVRLVSRTKKALPVLFVELTTEDYKPFVERIMRGETLGTADHPVYVAPESGQL